MKHTTYFNRYLRTLLLMLLAMTLLSLMGCGGGDDKKIAPNANPNGYFSGTADVRTLADDEVALHIPDLQVIIYDDRFMAMSHSNHLLYDGTISSVTGNNYEASVTIFEKGLIVGTASVEGQITTGSRVTGDFIGTHAGNGSFDVTYGDDNGQQASKERYQTDYNDEAGTGLVWRTVLYGEGRAHGFADATLDDTFWQISSANIGPQNQCIWPTDTSGAVFTAITNSNLYHVNLNFSTCHLAASNGDYTGLATLLTESETDDTFLVAYTNGTIGYFATYTKSPI